MKKIAFDVVAAVIGYSILAVSWASNLIESLAVKVTKFLGRLGYAGMKLIDEDRLKVYEEMNDPAKVDELQKQGLELKLLGAAQQVRDHAIQIDDWTEQHTDALNAVGDALIIEAGWKEDSVHAYLKELVESIDGLEYDVEGW